MFKSLDQRIEQTRRRHFKETISEVKDYEKSWRQGRSDKNIIASARNSPNKRDKEVDELWHVMLEIDSALKLSHADEFLDLRKKLVDLSLKIKKLNQKLKEL